MKVYSKDTSKNTGQLPMLSSWMLVSPLNSRAQNISIQVSEIPIGSEQPVHSHDPEQCYYIVKGRGLMTLEQETTEVKAGDAIYIPADN